MGDLFRQQRHMKQVMNEQMKNYVWLDFHVQNQKQKQKGGEGEI